MGIQGPSPFDPSPGSSTGPFAPPDGSELTDDEFLQWLQTMSDIHTVNASLVLNARTPRKRGITKNLAALTAFQDQVDAALGRLSANGPSLSETVGRIGEEGLQQALAKVSANANDKNKEALTKLSERASKEGGLVPFLQKRLADSQSAFSAQRPRMRVTFDSVRNGSPEAMGPPEPPPSAIQCAIGAAEVYVGFGTAVASESITVIGALGTVSIVGAPAGIPTLAAGVVGMEAAGDIISTGAGHISAEC